MNPTRSVVWAQLISILLVLLGGSSGINKLRNGINATVGRPVYGGDNITKNASVLDVKVFTGWALLFVIFVALSDNDTSAPLAVGFAYLLLLSIAMTVGPDAFKNLQSLVSSPATADNATATITTGMYQGKDIPI